MNKQPLSIHLASSPSRRAERTLFVEDLKRVRSLL